MLLQLAFVLIAIIIGARIGGIGLGVLGGLGLGILTFGFGLQPTSPPIDVMPVSYTHLDVYKRQGHSLMTLTTEVRNYQPHKKRAMTNIVQQPIHKQL